MDKNNNFGLLRLVLSSLVIVSHSPELVDGNRSREILTRLFGTMSFGEIAVDGFFIISGFLITHSFVSSDSTWAYFMRRWLRIVPGYVVSFLVCILLIAPFVGSTEVVSLSGIRDVLHQIITLSPPSIPGVFNGLPFPALNGSMWTISYEFRCYVAVAALGLLGVYRPKYHILLVWAVVILLTLNMTGSIQHHHHNGVLLGDPASATGFAAIFGVGSVYYLFRDRIPSTNIGAVVAAILLTATMFRPQFAETGFAIFGGYLILYAALRLPVLRLSRFTNRTDISYGIYLYGWPIQTLIIWNDREINPWLLCCLSLTAAAAAGYVSWILVERPCSRLARVRPLVRPSGVAF